MVSASLTKLMTAYTTFRGAEIRAADAGNTVIMSKNAAGEPPSKMFYKPGQAVTLDSALKMMLIKSANDIAVAIGETVAGSEPAFVNQMNAEAKRIGMTSSHFVNPNGLPGAGQYTTAPRSRRSGDHDQAASFRNMRRTLPMKASPRARKTIPTSIC